MSEELNNIRNKYKITVGKNPTIEVDETDAGNTADALESEMSFGAAADQFFQGLTFNTSDEIKAGVKSLFSDKSYDELVKEERTSLKETQEKFPIQSLAYQAGGALTSGVAAAPFTGGTSLLPTAGRLAFAGGKTVKGMAGAGALQSGLAAAGASEDGVVEDAGNILTTAGAGAILNPAVGKTVQLGGKLISGIVDYAVRKLQGSGKQVEDEIIRIVNQSDLSVEEIVSKVQAGEIIPEMTEGTRNAVLGFATQGGKGAQIVTDTLTARKNKFIDDTYQSLQKDLAPDTKGGNIYSTFVDNTDLLFKKESDAYNKIWSSEAGKTYSEIGDSVLQIATPNNARIINNFFRLAGREPIIKIVKGKPELTKQLSLEEGEIVKRAFMQEKQKSTNAIGEKLPAFGIMKNNEDFIKRVVDDLSPDLKKTRANYAAIKSSTDSYNEGARSLNMPSDKFFVATRKFFNKDGKVNPSKQKDLDAFRAGIASQIKAVSERSVGVRTGQITKLADINEEGITLAQRQNLERIYPDEKLDDILNKINQTNKTILTKARVDLGSKTARAQGEAKKVGMAQTGKLLTRAVTSVSAGIPDTDAIKGLFQTLSPLRSKQLPEDVQIKIANILVSENAEVLQDALTNRASRDLIISKIDALGSILQGGIQRGTTELTSEALSGVNPDLSIIGSAFAEEIDPADFKFVQDIATNVDEEAKNKIISAAQ